MLQADAPYRDQLDGLECALHSATGKMVPLLSLVEVEDARWGGGPQGGLMFSHRQKLETRSGYLGPQQLWKSGKGVAERFHAADRVRTSEKTGRFRRR